MLSSEWGCRGREGEPERGRKEGEELIGERLQELGGVSQAQHSFRGWTHTRRKHAGPEAADGRHAKKLHFYKDLRKRKRKRKR